MSEQVSRRRRIAQVISVILAGALTTLAFAPESGAATAVKGGKYGGTLAVNNAITVDFKVNKNGTKVGGFEVSVPPNSCGATPPLGEHSKPARIKHGRFKLELFIVTATGSQLPSEKVTGKFGPHNTENGTMTPSGLPHDCTDAFDYSASLLK